MKKNKKINFKIIITLLVIIAIIIAGIIIYKNNKKTEQEQGKRQEETTQQEQTEQIGLIDMNNTENAKIENGVKQNTSANILKDRDLNGIAITEIQLNAQEGISHFTATVKNNASTDFAGGVAKITFTNKDGSVYAEMEVYIPEMKAGATNAIDASTTADIANAYDFSIELEK